MSDAPRTAILVPCLNEALTVAKVVADFRRELPDATVYVYDNGSTDDTARVAAEAGAAVGREKRRGKGFVVARMLDEIDADLYVLVDGDDTYPAEAVHALLAPVLRGEADMTVGNRLRSFGDGSFRPAHHFGNRLVASTINVTFGSALEDVMSGFRVIHRDVVDRVPVVSRGFEIETALTLQCLHRDVVIVEVPIPYRGRPPGSHSKLRTLHDGARVLITIADVLKAYRPLLSFAAVALVVALASAALAAAPIADLSATGRTARWVALGASALLAVCAALCVACGLILDGVNHRLREVERVALKGRGGARA